MPVNLRSGSQWLGARRGGLGATAGPATPGVPPAPSFVPSDLANLQLWLSADSGTYTDTARTLPAILQGYPVGGWADQSGNARHASQGTATVRPTLWLDAVNGQPTLHFDGVDDVLEIASAAGLQFSTAATFFVVADVGSEGTNETLLCKGNATGDPDFIWSVGVGGGGRLALYNGTAFQNGTDGIVANNTFYVLELVWNGASLSFLASGTAGGTVATAVAWPTSTDALRIGQQGNAAANNISGGISEIVCYNVALGTTDRTSVRDYLMTKYGLPATPDATARQVLYYNGNPTDNLTTYRIGRALAVTGQTTRFTRVWPGEPVLSQGTGGAWDDQLIKDPWVLYDAGTWKMWYAGHDGTTYKLGYATSSDGITWTKSGSNPVLTVGAGGTWDSNHVFFPIVYKDAGAVAGKRYRMLYSGVNATGVVAIGYAYSADGIAWTKGASNPVVGVVPATWESAAVIGGALAKDGSTYYLYYEGSTIRTFPVDGQMGLVTFTDFEGTYTKSGSNPILARRTGDQALTANLTAGTTTVTIGNTSVFVVGETCWITNGTNGQQVDIASITDATHLEIADAAWMTFAAGAQIQTWLRCIFPRTVYKDGSTWRMWFTPYQVGGSIPEGESTYYATSSDPATGWAFSHTSDSPPLPLPASGVLGAWDARASENPMVVMDATTYTPVTYP